MNWKSLWLVALCSLLALTGGAKSVPLTVFDLKTPLRLISSDVYTDGGTLNFILVDAQGRSFHGGFRAGSKLSNVSCPQHCYVGGDYPTDPGVRLLPLWGAEERKLVKLLSKMINDSASADEIKTVADCGWNVPSNFHGPSHLIRAVEERRRTLEASDRGLLADPKAANCLFRGADTARVQSLVADWANNSYVVSFRDAEGKEIRIGYPATPDSAMNPVTLLGYNFVAGAPDDRRMMTLVAMTLGAGKHHGPPSVMERDRLALLEVLKVRTAKILEADKHCTSLDSGQRFTGPGP